MATKACHVVLIVVLLASARLGMSAPNWVSQLTNDINAMTHNIQVQVQRQVQQLNENLNSQIQQMLTEINRTTENLPRDAQGHIITNGNIISISTDNNVSKIIISGYTSDGEPFVRNIEERNDGKYLYHREIFHNPRTNSTVKSYWKLDLKTPGATPEIITDEN